MPCPQYKVIWQYDLLKREWVLGLRSKFESHSCRLLASKNGLLLLKFSPLVNADYSHFTDLQSLLKLPLVSSGSPQCLSTGTHASNFLCFLVEVLTSSAVASPRLLLQCGLRGFDAICAERELQVHGNLGLAVGLV